MLCLLQQRLGDVEVERELADIALGLGQAAIRPAGWPVSLASRSSVSPRKSRRTTSSLRRALQRTSRLASGSPLGTPEPRSFSIPASMTPDIVTSSV